MRGNVQQSGPLFLGRKSRVPLEKGDVRKRDVGVILILNENETAIVKKNNLLNNKLQYT